MNSLEKRKLLARRISLNADYSTLLATVKPKNLKRDVISVLLSRFDENDHISRDGVVDAISVIEKQWNLLKLLGRGYSLEAIDITSGMPDEFDFFEVFPDKEDVFAKFIISTLRFQYPEKAAKVIRLIAPDFNYTDIVKNAYENADRLGLNDIMSRIKESFPDIDFDS